MTTKAKESKETKTEQKGKEAVVPAPDFRGFELTLVGLTSLICHRFGEDQRVRLKERDEQAAKDPHGRRDIEGEYAQSLYPVPGREGVFGFPASAFKRSAVESASFADLTQKEVKGAFHILGDILPIEGVKPQKREGGDTVRIGRGVAQIRYRMEFPAGWRVRLMIRYDASVLSVEQIAHLFVKAGFSVGVGDWRPQKNGTHGMFEVR